MNTSMEFHQHKRYEEITYIESHEKSHTVEQEHTRNGQNSCDIKLIKRWGHGTV